MKELEYRFDAERIINKKKKLKRKLIEDNSKKYIEKKIAIGSETTHNIKLILDFFAKF